MPPKQQDKRHTHHPGVQGAQTADGTDYYFDSYAHLSIHEEMLKDTVRTNTYRMAILENAPAFAGKAVLDVGAGTGILSFFAVQAGARIVYAVEASDMADHAQKLVDSNGMSDRIKILKQRVEDVQLPEQVDIIISEWMGYFLIYESMLDSVLFARDHWLKKDGLMFPTRARLYMAPICDDETWAEKIDFWQNVYGVNMSSLVPFAVKCAFEEPMVEIVPPHMQIGREVLIKELDASTCSVADIPFSADFACTATHMGHVHGFFTWFDVLFDGPVRRVTLSTSPTAGYTHWRHSIFYFDEPVPVHQDDAIRGSIAARPNEENPRFIDVDVTYSIGADASQQRSKHYSMK